MYKHLEIMKNDTNNFAKRTASQVGAICRANGIYALISNLGDGRTFDIRVDSNIKNRFLLKQAGFILKLGAATDKYIIVKTF